jgi:DNA-binding protein H-NS
MSMKAPTRTAENSELKRQAIARRANGGKPVAMYRNTDGSTWTGRGLKPRWLVEAIEAGRSQDEFLIGA